MRNLFSAFFRRMQAKPKQPEAHGERWTWCLPFRLVCQNHMMHANLAVRVSKNEALCISVQRPQWSHCRL
jgi:hypothetical protein